MKRTLCRLILAAFALPGAARAESAPPRPVAGEQVTVTLHLVDVLVTDRDGKPIRGLRKGDFEVKVDGEKRPVATLDAASGPIAPPTTAAAGETPAPAAGTPVPPAAAGDGRWIVILFDADRISPEYRDVALRSARIVLQTQARPQDRYALAILRGGSLEYVQSFMPASDIPGAILSDPDQILGRTPSISQRMTELMDNVAGCRDSGNVESCVSTGTAEFVQLSRRESQQAIAALRDLVASLAPLPGRKALVLYSDGFVLQPGQIALTAAGRISESASAMLFGRLNDPPPWDFENLMSEASRARVTIFTLRTGTSLGMTMSNAEGRWNSDDKTRQGFDPFISAAQIVEGSLRQVAEATGGRAVVATASPSQVPPVVEQLDGIYTIGLAVVPGDSIRSKISVRLAGKSVGRVSAPSRLAYRSRLPAGIAGRIEVVPTLDGTGTDGARLELDTSTLATWRDPENGEEESRVALYYRLIDGTGKAVFDDYVLLRVPRRAGQTGPFTHPLRLVAGQGTYTASAAVSDLVGHGRATFTAAVTLVP